jgi:hypothetical protein
MPTADIMKGRRKWARQTTNRVAEREIGADMRIRYSGGIQGPQSNGFFMRKKEKMLEAAV